MSDRVLQDLDLNELKELLVSYGEPAYRAKQIFTKLSAGIAPSDMTDLPKALREKLDGAFCARPVRVAECVRSSDGSMKFLFALRDGHIVEGVFMPHDYGNTVCMSTQVGCRMGCAFCASGIDGLARNLSAGEMLSEIIETTVYTGKRVDNIVLMGSGEPLDNYDNVTKFLRLVNAPEGLNIGQRSISLSTCGLCDRVRQLADDGFSVTLSVSLHATTDDNRRAVMPIANKYSIRDITEAAKYYFDKTGRRVIYEYALIKDNMTFFDAKRLKEIVKGYAAHVNLIMLNPVKEKNVQGCTKQEAARFLERLQALNVSATIRRSMGADIEGACGQLRRKRLGL